MKKLIAAGVAAASYVMLPDILSQEETVAFLVIVAWALYTIMAIIESELREIYDKREALRIRKPRNGSMSKFNLPKKIIKFPVEERFERKEGTHGGRYR